MDLGETIENVANKHLADNDMSHKEQVRRLGRRIDRLKRRVAAQGKMMASVGDSLKETASSRDVSDIESTANQVTDL